MIVNTGISFGLFPSISPYVLVIVLWGVVIIAVKTRELWGRVGLGLMLLGGVSNFVSRMRHGGVMDNLSLGSMLYNNLADYLIFFGLVIYGYTYFVRGQRDRRD